MASEDQPIVVVCGATGSQGGGVVRGLLAAGNVRIRGITRNIESEKAQALTAQGVEMVAATFDDPEALNAAFAGANRAFIITNYWAPDVMNGDKELQQVKNIADAAKAQGVDYVVFSTFEDTRPALADRPVVDEKWKVPHFDAKHLGNEYMNEIGLKAYFLNTAFYFENFMSFFGGLSKKEDGGLLLTQPTGADDKPFCLVSVSDIGAAAARILANPELGEQLTQSNGGSPDFGFRPEWLTAADCGRILGAATGLDITGTGMDYDAYAAAAPMAGDEMANMFYFYCEKRDAMLGTPEFAREILPDVQTFEQWCGANAEALRAAFRNNKLIE